jgi:hypothetical protein
MRNIIYMSIPQLKDYMNKHKIQKGLNPTRQSMTTRLMASYNDNPDEFLQSRCGCGWPCEHHIALQKLCIESLRMGAMNAFFKSSQISLRIPYE